MLDYPHQPGSKAAGTSLQAADEMKGPASILRTRVMVLLEHNVDGVTADEAAAALCQSVLSIRPRFSELLAKGFIKDSGERRRNTSCKTATVWQIVLPHEQMKLL